VSEEEIQTTLGHILERLASFEDQPETHQATKDDFVRLKIKASEAGQEFKQAAGDNIFLSLTDNYYGEVFTKNILGSKKGDKKSFQVSYDEQSHLFASHTLDFDVEVNSISQKKLPEWYDETVKKIGPFENFEALKTRVKNDLSEEKESRAVNEVKEEFVDWLINENPLYAPQSLINQQFEYLTNDAAQNLANMNLDQSKIEERLKEWQAEMEKRALRQVQASLLLSEIARKENIQASQEEIRNEIVKYASQMQRKPQEVFEELRSRGLLPGIVKQLTELKTLDTFARKALKKDE
jgi:trigger factor